MDAYGGDEFGHSSFGDLGAVADARVTLTDANGTAESYSATQVTANAFTILGKNPLIGRDFAPHG